MLAGRFHLLRVLGTGGSGVVFAARDARLNQPVAIKVLHPGQMDSRGLQRMRREVQAARGGHPHMVAVYDLHETDGLHFLSMELVEGVSLRDRLKGEGQLDVGETVRIGCQVASALAHLHERGIVHRDVKPGNILLTANGNAKLCDMGLARSLEPGLTVTETAMVVGTPAYMAPEQATGEELTPAADIYALGVTLYQSLTNEVPLVDATALSTLMRRQKERAPSVRRTIPDAPRWLARLVRRMLEPEPPQRPGAAEVKRAMESRRYRYRPRRRTVAAAAALLAASVAVPAIHSQIRRNETVRFEVTGGQVRGLDAHGRTTWTRSLATVVNGTVRADIDGDGRDELVITTKDVDKSRNEVSEPAGVMVFDLHGRVVTSVRLRDVIREWTYAYPLLLESDLHAEDLDEDGRDELVVLCRQVHFFPSELLIYWPAKDVWQTVLEHPGHLRLLAALPDARHPVLRFGGMMNRPIYTRVVGQITLDPSELRASSVGPRARLRSGTRSVPGAFLDWYTILDQRRKSLMGSASRLVVREDGGTLIQVTDGMTVSVDRWGNPEFGPNVGLDLRGERCAFLEGLGRLQSYLEAASPESVRQLADEIRTRVQPLLSERPYRVAFDVVEARSLARAGDLDGAIGILRATVRDTHSDDAVVRLGHLLGVAGRLREAVSVLEPAVTAPVTQRAKFDGRLLLFRLAVELDDRSLADRCLFHYGTGGRRAAWNEGTTAAILARAHLWWDEVTETDCRVRSWPYEPAGEALACLARWRLGRTASEDPGLMREGDKLNPEALHEFRIGAAAAHLGLGRPGEALLILERIDPGLRSASADDFEIHQLLDLARALHARALLAAGHPEKARAEARTLLQALTPGRLPARVVEEVLR